MRKVKLKYQHVPSNITRYPSLALPDPLSTGAYRLDIISAVLRGSGTVHSTKKYQSQQFSLGVNKVTCTFVRPIN